MLYLGADHRGYYLKEQIKKYLDGKKIAYQDLGNTEYTKEDDYPDFAYWVGKYVGKRPTNRGILICGSGIGVAVVANKFKGIRAATVGSVAQVKAARHDDNVNIIAFAGDDISIQKARSMIDAFLSLPFSLAKNHRRRVEKIRLLEQGKWSPKK